MTARSTRDKIRWQANKIAQNVERCIEHLRFMEGLAAGQHPVVEEGLPKLVVLFADLLSLIEDFRDRL